MPPAARKPSSSAEEVYVSKTCAERIWPVEVLRTTKCKPLKLPLLFGFRATASPFICIEAKFPPLNPEENA